jgi:RNA polymerase sigma-70 factor (ECF subfamily)
MPEQANNDENLSLLMLAVQRGDADAYRTLLNDVTPRLRRMIYGNRRFLNQEDVEDIVQDVLISMHSVRATYDARRPFLPWLMAIARNRLADSGRRWARRFANEVRDDEVLVTFPDDSANSEPERRFDSDELRSAMRELPIRQRQAIEMVKLRELSLKEAASESGMTVGALKVAVHRGVLALRKILARDQ